MVCSCCANIMPHAAVSLFVTAALTHFAASSTNSKTLRYISYIPTTLLSLLASLLSALSYSPSLRAKFFVSLCAVLSKPGPIDDIRCPLVNGASGNVLEVGPGAGANFRCLVNATDILSYTTVEPNAEFTDVLLSEARDQNLNFEITPTWLKGEEMDIADASIDTVVGTHVLCSVDNPQQVLANIDKALKVGGTYLSMEHVSASSSDRPLLSLSQNLLSPFFQIIANGCTFRDAEAEISAALGDRYEIVVDRYDAPMPLAAFKPHVSIKAKKLKAA